MSKQQFYFYLFIILLFINSIKCENVSNTNTNLLNEELTEKAKNKVIQSIENLYDIKISPSYSGTLTIFSNPDKTIRCRIPLNSQTIINNKNDKMDKINSNKVKVVIRKGKIINQSETEEKLCNHYKELINICQGEGLIKDVDCLFEIKQYKEPINIYLDQILYEFDEEGKIGIEFEMSYIISYNFGKEYDLPYYMKCFNYSPSKKEKDEWNKKNPNNQIYDNKSGSGLVIAGMGISSIVFFMAAFIQIPLPKYLN